MNKLIRIDERLIHGQVAFLWTKHLNLDRILVANDSVADNEIQKTSLIMAAGDRVKASIVKVKEAVEILNDERIDKLKVLVLVNNPEDALYICENATNIPKVNVGNYGRVSGKIKEKKAVTENLYVEDNDINTFKKIIDLKIPLEYQLVPDNTPLDLTSKF
ncbi:PTS sugar transporter subunit IIB [Niallia sp. Man26]|uniref:PTS system mannose/fructose/N-acetylgalactosamine-transporter subunit IIB n=1 Tax=Niallia sp. Man26 TaxID=2912824 RepID=UPI001EDB5C93|nr:PTS sugar transporter subunit IIB [Niallia sp. Man26]UPO90133.1 PTS sugar transporter subunit IIB [Niallia sp. Man26]